jgi:hypothetical protein
MSIRIKSGLLCDSLQRLFAVFGFGDLIIGRGQHIPELLITLS